MLGGNQKLIALTLLIGVQFLSRSIQPSEAFGTAAIFPKVNVTLKNEASHGVYLKCGFDETKDQTLQKLEPGEARWWSFVEVWFPLRWCYLHISNDNRGAFWAFTVFLKCSNCSWSIRNDGPYHFNHRQVWKKHKLYLQY
ncbi:hypothetical protein V6N13_133955 [Hibiscus sabdariffa]|uniref:S-protein homolog n=1 Tax=Hibiscus sabdariffa TaxID=183260 RepID=A0ABR2QZT7_9ROSI